jgi:hypothetical protein
MISNLPHSQEILLIRTAQTLQTNKLVLHNNLHFQQELRALDNEKRIEAQNFLVQQRNKRKNHKKLIHLSSSTPKDMQQTIDSMFSRIEVLRFQALNRQQTQRIFLASHSTNTTYKNELQLKITDLSNWKSEVRTILQDLSYSVDRVQLQFLRNKQMQARFILKYCPVTTIEEESPAFAEEVLVRFVSTMEELDSRSLPINVMDGRPSVSSMVEFEEVTPDIERSSQESKEPGAGLSLQSVLIASAMALLSADGLPIYLALLMAQHAYKLMNDKSDKPTERRTANSGSRMIQVDPI